MFQALIVMLREGVEAALVIGIAMAYLRKTGRDGHVRWVYVALAVAVAASLALGYAFARLNWNQDRFEGWVMLGAATLVVTLVVWMMRAGKRIKQRIEAGLERGAQAPSSAAAVFLFVLLMVLREGVETVLMLAAVSLSSDGLMTVAGTAVGLGLAVTFGVLFVRGSLRIDLGKFFRMTSIILIFVAAQLVISGLHELSEQGVLPSSKAEMAVIGPIVRNDIFFFVTMLALAGLMMLLDWRARPARVAEAANSAERRKALWLARRERLWMAAVSSAAFIFIMLVTAEFIYAKSQTALSPASELAAENGTVRIPVSEIEDGILHRYRVGRTRFLVIRRPGMDPGVALDACEICGDAGYYQRGGNVFCKNCAAAMYIPSIGVGGGCNPIPLKHRLESGYIVIDTAELESQAKWFK